MKMLFTGTIIFLTGMAINVYHDGVLIRLRTDLENKEGKGGYKIPRKGLFELISGANYFGEIVEWWGLFVVTNGIPQVGRTKGNVYFFNEN